MSDFFGLNIGRTALQAQRKALDVTGQNIANVNTEGYTRQRANLESIAAPSVPAFHANWVRSGQGVIVTTVDRLSNRYLDMRSYQEHATGSNLSQAQATLTNIELAFAEPSDLGLGQQLADLFSGFDELANHPEQRSVRNQLVERAKTLAAGFNQLDDTFDGLRTNAIEQLEGVVREVNELAAGVADLNARIRNGTLTGHAPNELMDKRDVLIGKLSERVGVSVVMKEFGQVDVMVGGTALVRENTSEQLTVDTTGPIGIRWVRTALPVTVNGTTGGMLATSNDIVPRYKAALAVVTQRLADDVNALHVSGFDMNGNPGQPFFTIDAAGIHVNAAIVADSNLVAASSSATAQRNGSIAGQIAALSAPEEKYRDLVVALGVESAAVNRRVDVQNDITREVDAARQAESGVNLDEEMTKLIAEQHAYDAAARFVSAVDKMLDILLNMAR